MEDTNSIKRELKKQQLRKQMVSNAGPIRYSPGDHEEKEREEGSQEAGKKRLSRRVLTGGIILLAVFLTVGIIMYRNTYHQYTEYSVSWETDFRTSEEGQLPAESTFTAYKDFGENVIKYTKDGAAYIDAKGKTVWIQAYEMRAPIVAVNGDYAAIADQQGNSIYIFDKNGCQGIATALLPILKVSVSAKGLAAAILEDAKSNYIGMFQKDGKTLDIVIKSRLSGDGYPLDFCLSPEGNQVICSYMYINQGRMECRVVFYNFSEIGKNTSENRLVAGFDEDFKGSMAPRVHFLDEVYSFACSDKGLSFFSSRNLASPQLLLQVPMENQIRSLFYSDRYIGVILDNGEGESPYRMEIYHPTGELALKKEFNFRYQHVSIDGEQILMWNENSFEAYNMAGTQKFYGVFEETISKVKAGRFSNSYLIIGQNKMKEIVLQ
ncbi:MAG: hypothetical protein HFG49_04915 [Lachnospiraceae bacterium]|jgi:hypothetical protein|nr:hypothetical protein [Lachnospiraceae bacterium]